MSTRTILDHEHTWSEPYRTGRYKATYIRYCTDRACEAVIDISAERRSAIAKKAAATRRANDELFGVKDVGFEVGDILTGSWGYDQTNIEFYQVVALKGRSVTIRPVTLFTSATGPQDHVYPCKDQFTSEPIRKMVDRWGGVKLYDFGCYLHKWDGGARHQTGMGWGH